MSHTVTGDWFDQIREHFFGAAGTDEPEAVPAGPTAEDLSGLSLGDFGEQRAALGIKNQTDFIGVGDDDASGLPDWRNPIHLVPEQTPMDQYAVERAAAGIKETSAVFGAAPPRPRVNRSSWSVS